MVHNLMLFLPAGNVATYVWDGSIAEVKGNEIPGVFKKQQMLLTMIN